MNTTEIEILLNKYYQGESTLDEEKILKTYFLSGNVDPKLRQHIPMFEFYNQESLIKADDRMEQQILEKMENANVVPFYNRRNFRLYFAAIAASLIFLFTFIYESSQYSNNPNSTENTGYTKEETRVAYEQTRIALAYVSEKYTRGTEPLGDIAKFNNGTKPISELAKFGIEMNTLNSNVEKMGSGVDNLSKLSKFTIIVKP